MVDTCDVPNIMERDYECRRSFLHSFPLFREQMTDILVSYSSDVASPAFFVPNLERLASDTVQDGKESTLQANVTSRWSLRFETPKHRTCGWFAHLECIFCTQGSKRMKTVSREKKEGKVLRQGTTHSITFERTSENNCSNTYWTSRQLGVPTRMVSFESLTDVTDTIALCLRRAEVRIGPSGAVDVGSSKRHWFSSLFKKRRGQLSDDQEIVVFGYSVLGWEVLVLRRVRELKICQNSGLWDYVHDLHGNSRDDVHWYFVIDRNAYVLTQKNTRVMLLIFLELIWYEKRYTLPVEIQNITT